MHSRVFSESTLSLLHLRHFEVVNLICIMCSLTASGLSPGRRYQPDHVDMVQKLTGALQVDMMGTSGVLLLLLLLLLQLQVIIFNLCAHPVCVR